MSDCGHVYKNGCYSCLETKIDKIENKIDKLLMYKTSEAGYKDGYEKGVRDMWEAGKKNVKVKHILMEIILLNVKIIVLLKIALLHKKY